MGTSTLGSWAPGAAGAAGLTHGKWGIARQRSSWRRPCTSIEQRRCTYTGSPSSGGAPSSSGGALTSATSIEQRRCTYTGAPSSGGAPSSSGGALTSAGVVLKTLPNLRTGAERRPQTSACCMATRVPPPHLDSNDEVAKRMRGGRALARWPVVVAGQMSLISRQLCRIGCSITKGTHDTRA